MRQSNNKKSRDVTAFLYERLSRDDNLEGESYRGKATPTWSTSWTMAFPASQWTALVLWR